MKINQKFIRMILIAAVMTLTSTAVFAQAGAEKARGWAARALNVSTVNERTTTETEAATIQSWTEARGNQANVTGGGVLDIIGRAREARQQALVGTWRVSIPTSATGLPPFNAYQTFHQGGTFTEASDLLPTLTESPAFGVWDLDGDKYLLTFELFIFDDKKAPVGRIRVRCSIKLLKADEFTADAIVDLIEPDGNVILDIDRTPFTGKMIKPLPLQ